MYIWIKLRWTERYRVLSNIGNVKLHSDFSDDLSTRSQGFISGLVKHSFIATGDRSGGGNGTEKGSDSYSLASTTLSKKML